MSGAEDVAATRAVLQTPNRTTKIGIIGGSGLDDPDILEGRAEERVTTPYGDPSDALITGNSGYLRRKFGRATQNRAILVQPDWPFHRTAKGESPPRSAICLPRHRKLVVQCRHLITFGQCNG